MRYHVCVCVWHGLLVTSLTPSLKSLRRLAQARRINVLLRGPPTEYSRGSLYVRVFAPCWKLPVDLRLMEKERSVSCLKVLCCRNCWCRRLTFLLCQEAI